ncbi:MAG: hypothetical protein ABL903_12450 [Methylococcales bacterium]
MATFRKIQNKSGVVFRAIIKDRFGKLIKSKTFTRKTDARNWATRVEADQEIIDSFGNKGAKMTFAELL